MPIQQKLTPPVLLFIRNFGESTSIENSIHLKVTLLFCSLIVFYGFLAPEHNNFGLKL